MRRILGTLLLVAFALSTTPVLLAQEAITSATPDTIKHLRESATKDRAFADEQQKRADAWRELALKARRNADETADATNKASWLKDAEDREARAREIEAEAARLRAVAEEKDARAARLEQAYNEKYGPQPAPAVTPEAPAQPTSQPLETRPAVSPPAQTAAPETPDWMLADLLGLWARTSEPGMTLALVPEAADASPGDNRIEAHSDRRRWKGAFRPGTETEPGNHTLARKDGQ